MIIKERELKKNFQFALLRQPPFQSRMGLKIKGIEFIYDGTTRLIFDDEGKVKEHRDYFDFCSGTFGKVPVIGAFFRWLYSRFVD